jgi:2-phospho-L-lactate guanylyltransferase
VDAILIPVKHFHLSKMRLAESLPSDSRRRLGLAMLADVLRATEKWERRYIVTADLDAEAVGLAFGCTLVADPGEELNGAINAGTRKAMQDGTARLLVLPADVPAVAADDLTRIFSAPEPVVLARSWDGGTNALLRNPPEIIAPKFGPQSAEAHQAAAAANGLECATVDAPSLYYDIDRFEDLQRLAELPGDRESIKIARELATR